MGGLKVGEKGWFWFPYAGEDGCWVIWRFQTGPDDPCPNPFE